MNDHLHYGRLLTELWQSGRVHPRRARRRALAGGTCMKWTLAPRSAVRSSIPAGRSSREPRSGWCSHSAASSSRHHSSSACPTVRVAEQRMGRARRCGLRNSSRARSKLIFTSPLSPMRKQGSWCQGARMNARELAVRATRTSGMQKLEELYSLICYLFAQPTLSDCRAGLRSRWDVLCVL